MLKYFFNIRNLYNLLINSLNIKKFVTILTFSLIFIIGVISVKDYGTINDEYNNRFRSLVTLNYLGDKFIPTISEKYKANKKIPKLSEVSNTVKFYGGDIIHVPLTLVEIIFGIEDKKDAFLLRHYTYFVIFFFSLIAFYNILKIHFIKWEYCIIGVLILFLTPRIFANSFYNNSDIPLMAFTIFSVNYGLKILKKISYKRIILFSLFSAAAINIRIMGLIVPVFLCLAIFISSIQNKEEIKKIFLNILKISSLTFLLYILSFPSLWESPFKNTFAVFTQLANHPMGGYHLYLGSLINFFDTPWHYVPVWIFVTTPIFYTLFFIVGLCDLLRSFFNNKKDLLFIQDFFFLLLLITPILSVIILNSTLYDGWRHLYFIYPFYVIFIIKGFVFLLKSLNNYKKIKKLLQISILFILLDTGVWMINNHPYQYVYFNKLIRNVAAKNFELDYLTASYKTNYDFLIENEKKDIYLIAENGNRSLFYSLFSLTKKERQKFKIIDKSKAEYLITSYNLDNQAYDMAFFEKYEILNEVVVDGIKINSLFKLKK